MKHAVKEVLRNMATRQWEIECSCGHKSFDKTKSEAIQWHRDHVDTIRSAEPKR